MGAPRALRGLQRAPSPPQSPPEDPKASQKPSRGPQGLAEALQSAPRPARSPPEGPKASQKCSRRPHALPKAFQMGLKASQTETAPQGSPSRNCPAGVTKQKLPRRGLSLI